jgi:D-glycero-D-manno-heptose 1,7-bisphosphate phosphatase
MTGRRFALLDRDGTINVERGILGDPDGIELLPGAAEGLRCLGGLGLGLVVVSNQSGVGRGHYTVAQADAVNARLSDLLARDGIVLDGIYICPHTPDDGCDCRKPAPGMAHRAARELGFDTTRVFMIGDKAIDVGMGRRIGATTFLVRTGYGKAEEEAAGEDADYVVDDLAQAAKLIASVLTEEMRADSRG